MISRRAFMGSVAGSACGIALCRRDQRTVSAALRNGGVRVVDIEPGDGVFEYVHRVAGGFDNKLYKQILGAANEFKEGDQILGVAAENEDSRRNARTLLAHTRVADIDRHPVHEDQLHGLLTKTTATPAADTPTTLGDLKHLLLNQDERDIKSIMAGLSSDVIGCVVKLMANAELISVGVKVFNPLPGSQIGSRGFLGARIQPNSPTDHLDDIVWQVFDGWSYAVGDVVLGNNPVSSDPASVAAIEKALKDLLETFQLQDAMPHCVLAHIDVQAKVEKGQPGSTALWFQSIAGTDDANETFDISVDKMLEYASQRDGHFGLYFETGQGADFTNGHGHGFDMVLHEARKYGFARALKQAVGKAQAAAGSDREPWVHLNDVAGFIGPEVFRTRDQLVRCCLEDIVMGKLHGLCIGLDVCSTLHMDVSLDDLDWCLDQVLPANPAYLMALPTKIDPMLGYLTTGFQDHVRLRDKFGYKVDDRLWHFFRELEVIDDRGRPTEHFGDPSWVNLKYRRRKGDSRSDEAILKEGSEKLEAIRRRGVFIAERYGSHPWNLEPKLKHNVERIYADAKKSIWTELAPAFVDRIPGRLQLETQSLDRNDYILHPESGEQLRSSSVERLLELRTQYGAAYDVQIVVSDGLNALAIMDEGHLAPFLKNLHDHLDAEGFRTAPRHVVLTSGRVRAGYRIGESLFADLKGPRAVMHVIGERPGTGHHTFSVYISAPTGDTWAQPGKVDHNITKVVSGIATTALDPERGAAESVRLLKTMV